MYKSSEFFQKHKGTFFLLGNANTAAACRGYGADWTIYIVHNFRDSVMRRKRRVLQLQVSMSAAAQPNKICTNE